MKKLIAYLLNRETWKPENQSFMVSGKGYIGTLLVMFIWIAGLITTGDLIIDFVHWLIFGGG
jgi:hypothetical protein